MNVKDEALIKIAIDALRAVQRDAKGRDGDLWQKCIRRINDTVGPMPERIQRKRTKGWQMPSGAVYVGRPSKWGNPYANPLCTAEYLVECYRYYILTSPKLNVKELRGHSLACWCPLDQPCHADVLLELANA